MSGELLLSCLQQQERTLTYFCQQVDQQQLLTLVELINQCPGTIHLTGVGKSGWIGQCLSKMLVSIGIRSSFLSPMDAVHGDLGLVNSGDLLIFISKSGRSQELLPLIPICRQRGVRMVALVSVAASPLAVAVDQTVILPVDQELCPHNSAPTSSSVIQLLAGNTLVGYLMTQRQMSSQKYGQNHPGGSIGQRITCRVADVMIPVADLPLMSVGDLLVTCLNNMTGRGCLLIVQDQALTTVDDLKIKIKIKTVTPYRLVGIFTDGDLRRMVQSQYFHGFQETIGQWMTPQPITIQADQLAVDCLSLMEDPPNTSTQKEQKKRVKELPVLDGSGNLVGLVLLHDLVRLGISTFNIPSTH